MTKKTIIIILVTVTILALGYLVFIFKPVPEITSFTPQDGQTSVSTSTTINIIFNNELTNEQKNQTKVIINPQINFDSNWIGKILEIKPKTDLNVSTKYLVDVNYDSKKLLSFSFTTSPVAQSQLELEGSKQGQADYLFGQDYLKFIKDNPWYGGLPIDKNDYTIVYDFNTKSFRIRLKNQVSDADKQKFISQALSDLKNIGYSTDPIPYYVLNK